MVGIGRGDVRGGEPDWISTAIVTESLASMNRCSAACRARLSPNIGNTKAAIRVTKFSLLMPISRESSTN